jgi:hypothetical protein
MVETHNLLYPPNEPTSWSRLHNEFRELISAAEPDVRSLDPPVETN